MHAILKALVFLFAVSLAAAPEAHAQWVDDCRDGETYTVIMDLEYGEGWKDSEEYEAIYLMLLEAPVELRLGAMRLYARKVASVDWSGSPAGVEVDSHDTLLFGDLFFSEAFQAYQQRIINHELAHIWAFNHLCALEDFARIGWESISNEGRSGTRRASASFPERDLAPHDYATYSPQEDFAVSVEMYLEDPEGFTKQNPQRGAWLAEHLFTPSGCPTEFLCDVGELFKYGESKDDSKADFIGPEYEEPEESEEPKESDDEDPNELGEDPIF